MLYDIIFVAVVVLIIAGFWWTRGVKGASPFDSAERRVDAMSRTSMTGGADNPIRRRVQSTALTVAPGLVTSTAPMRCTRLAPP